MFTSDGAGCRIWVGLFDKKHSLLRCSRDNIPYHRRVTGEMDRIIQYVFLCVLLQTGRATSSWEQGYPRPGPASLGLDPVPGRGGLHTLFQPVERCQVLREGTGSDHQTTTVLSRSKKKKVNLHNFVPSVCAAVFLRHFAEMLWSGSYRLLYWFCTQPWHPWSRTGNVVVLYLFS